MTASTVVSRSPLALAEAERDEYRAGWQATLRRELDTLRRLRLAEDARDDLLARIEAVLELLAGDDRPLAVEVVEILQNAKALTVPVAAAEPPPGRVECPACGRVSALRQDGEPRAHRSPFGGRCNGRSA